MVALTHVMAAAVAKRARMRIAMRWNGDKMNKIISLMLITAVLILSAIVARPYRQLDTVEIRR
jgi:hypothetical protein